MAEYTCTCDACGMEFAVHKFDTEKDTLKDGHEISVVSFSCPKCDERFIVTVRDEESARLRDILQESQERYRQSYNPNDLDTGRRLRNEVGHNKRALLRYMYKLKRRYLKELKKRGK